jgi:hypothetical protein
MSEIILYAVEHGLTTEYEDSSCLLKWEHVEEAEYNIHNTYVLLLHLQKQDQKP